jgi:predicted PurR-regulated permease PerM
MSKNNSAQEITISNKTIVRIIGIAILAYIGIRLLDNLVHPLTLIFVSAFLATALNPVVTKVAAKLKSKSRTRATALAYVGVVSVLIAFFALFVPPLVRQTADFVSDIPQTLSELEEDEGFIGDMVRRYNLEEQISEFANNWSSDFTSLGNDAVSLVSRIVSNIVSIVTVLILTFMMLIEGPRMLKAFWKVYPKNRRAHAQKMVKKIYGVVTKYVVGQIFVAGLGALFAITALFIASAIFGVSGINPVALGGIVFFFSLIPTIGTIIGSSLVVLFSLFASVPLAVLMLIYFIVYQQIENATIQPIIQSRGIELTPMLVFIAAIIGISLAGPLGAFVAIPVAGSIKVFVDDYLESRNLK